MNVTKLLLISSIASALVGQTLRFSFFTSTAAITISDILVVFTLVIFLLESKRENRRIIFPPIFMVPLSLFAVYAMSVNVLALLQISYAQDIVATMFLIRFLAYSSLAIVVKNVSSKKMVTSWLNIILVVGFIFTIIGFIQVLLIPDLTFLAAYGWDPHQSRIVSSLLDPNFTGYLLTIFLALSISFFLFTKKTFYIPAILLFLFALIFTFSRSSYLAFLAVLINIGIIKSPKLILVILLILIASFVAVPRVQNRLIGALTIDKTAEARIESWRNALKISAKHPFFGVGFDAYRAAQEREGFFNVDQPQGGHSGSGTDSSLLLVLATTGIFGLLVFFAFIASLAKLLFVDSQKYPVKLAASSALVGLLVHSIFVNSLFFTQIMLIFYFMVGLSLVYDN